jgi:putative endonuclease
MIWRAKKNDGTESAPHWYVLVVRCADGSLCTEVHGDVEGGVRRINQGLGMPYTRSRLPVFVVHTEEYMNELDAKARAAEIRSLTKPQKERMLSDLSVCAMERTGRAPTLRAGLSALSDIFR